MPHQPTAKVALVTGCARRIGRAIALELARDRWTVAVHYRSSRQDAERVVSEIETAGGRAFTLQADLAVPAGIEALLEKCVAFAGPPVCLVNNASEFRPDRIDSLTAEQWDAHLDTNLRAPVLLAQAMRRSLPAGAAGNIINIIDQRVWNLTPDFFSYTLSKAGLWAATRMLAQALAPDIRVNAIGPGPVLQSIYQSREEFAAEARSTLLGRGPTPDEIADAVRFILGATSMTGQMIALDGGQHLTRNAEGSDQPAQDGGQRDR